MWQDKLPNLLGATENGQLMALRSGVQCREKATWQRWGRNISGLWSLRYLLHSMSRLVAAAVLKYQTRILHLTAFYLIKTGTLNSGNTAGVSCSPFLALLLAFKGRDSARPSLGGERTHLSICTGVCWMNMNVVLPSSRMQIVADQEIWHRCDWQQRQ